MQLLIGRRGCARSRWLLEIADLRREIKPPEMRIEYENVQPCLNRDLRWASSWRRPPLNPHLEPLRPLLEKTWKGTFTNSKPGNPIVDVGRWERVLNGQAVRRIHSVNEGAYGGESLIFWDEQKKAVSVYYVTTAGFQSLGTLEFKDGKFVGAREHSRGRWWSNGSALDW